MGDGGPAGEQLAGSVDARSEGLRQARDVERRARVHGHGVAAGAGFTRLFNMEGGITSWAKEIDPSMPTY